MSDDNQHWVSKFHIKNFADADGRVFCLDIQTDEVKKRPPKHAASSVGFNDYIIDGDSVSFEERLEKIETPAAPILKRIASERSTAGLTPDQRDRVAVFVAAQSFRTEAFYKGLELGSPRQDFGAIFAELWRSAFLVSDEIERRKWVVMAIEHDDVFYLGDHPVVLQRTEEPSAAGELGFDIEGVEAFLPLTPKCALYMPCTSISQQIISGYDGAMSIHKMIRSAALRGQSLPGTNSEALYLSQRVIRDSHALYRALTTGASVTAAPENVENLNYLQCSWAHSAVYSNRGDFSFAKRVLRQTPQYRASPRTSLAPATIRTPRKPSAA